MKDCIAIEASRLGIISQYTLTYCDAGDKRQGWAVSQYNPAKPATRLGTVPATRHRSWALGARGVRAHGRWARRASGRARHARQVEAGQARGRLACVAGVRHVGTRGAAGARGTAG